MFDVNFAGMCFLFTFWILLIVLFRFDWLRIYFGRFTYSVPFCDWFAKRKPDLMLISACLERT